VGTWPATASRDVCIYLKITLLPWEERGSGNISRYRLGKNFNSKKRKRGNFDKKKRGKENGKLKIKLLN
jgi:hypothetical protein